jgi:hypothetical protein
MIVRNSRDRSVIILKPVKDIKAKQPGKVNQRSTIKMRRR